jgi:hypothetical protein
VACYIVKFASDLRDESSCRMKEKHNKKGLRLSLSCVVVRVLCTQPKALNINLPRKKFLYVGSALILNYISTMRYLMWLFTSLGCIVGESPAAAKPA